MQLFIVALYSRISRTQVLHKNGVLENTFGVDESIQRPLFIEAPQSICSENFGKIRKFTSWSITVLLRKGSIIDAFILAFLLFIFSI